MASAGRNFNKNLRSNYALNLAETRNEATIDIFGVIGLWWDGVESRQFVEEIKALDVDRITINISSPGGFVDDGLMIYDAIRSHRAFVTARLSGVVASAATWIACAADEVVGSDTLLYMIHNVQGFAMGDKDEMRKAADISEKMENVIVNLYRKKTGQRKSTLQRWLDAETWFTLDEAIENGFVDKRGDGFSFSYEAKATDEDIREFMTNTLNCVNLPALKSTNQNDNTMSDFSPEQKGWLENLFSRNNKAAKADTEKPEAQTNELEELRNQVQELTQKLEEATNGQNQLNFENLVNGITNALKPQIENAASEAATNAANEVKAELESKVDDLTEKVQNATQKIEATNALENKVNEVAKAVNSAKELKAQPEIKDNNGEGLEKVVAPVNTWESFVKSINNN